MKIKSRFSILFTIIITIVNILSSPTSAQEIINFTTSISSISRQSITNGMIIPVSWIVSNRPENSNLVFVQVIPQGTGIPPTYRNVELPRDFEIVSSIGDGWLDPVLPTIPALNSIGSEFLIFQMRLVNLSDNSTMLIATINIDVTDTDEILSNNVELTPNDCEHNWFGDQSFLEWYQPDLSLSAIESTLCPDGDPISLPAQYQPYENGFMIYVGGERFALEYGRDGFRFRNYDHLEEVPNNILLEAPEGLFVPDNLFFSIWQRPFTGKHGVSLDFSELGWATTPIQNYTTRFQEKTMFIVGMGLNWGNFIMMTTPTNQTIALIEPEGSGYIGRWFIGP